MINIRKLYVSFTKEYDALHNINLTIADGEKVALVGDSESGKTTLLRVIARLENFKKGEVYINDINVKKIDFKQDVSLAYVPKTPVFKENKTVIENLEYVLKIRNYDSANINLKVLSALQTFNIERYKNMRVKDLTNYQRILVQLARVSLRKVDIFLIDNIVDGLDKTQEQEMIKYLKDLMDFSSKSTFVFAFNNEKFAKDFQLKIYKLKLGSL